MISITLLSISLGMIITRHWLEPSHRGSVVIEDCTIIFWTSIILLYQTHILPTILQTSLILISAGSTIVTFLNIFFDTTDDHQNQTYERLIVFLSFLLALIGIVLSTFNK